MSSLRQQALRVLLLTDPQEKIDTLRAVALASPVGASEQIAEPAGIPGRPAALQFVPPQKVPRRSVSTVAGRAALLHSIAHIEFNAINLALDIIWRYPDLPDGFYGAWFNVALEEALHFQLLRDYLLDLGVAYGDLACHDGLWEMAERTRHDLLARLALVPRTLEARGLDACPIVRAKLAQAGDHVATGIMDIILRDEVGHVALGNYWYRELCRQRDLSDFDTYQQMAVAYRAPRLRGPFNRPARLAAGFTERELHALEQQDQACNYER